MSPFLNLNFKKKKENIFPKKTILVSQKDTTLHMTMDNDIFLKQGATRIVQSPVIKGADLLSMVECTIVLL